MRKKRWLFIGIYKQSSRNSQYFLNILADLLDFYLMQYDNKLVLEAFNLKLNNPILLDFLNDYDFTNLIKRNICFKGDGSCIDLVLTNRKFLFTFATIFETSLSDHHHLIFSLIKTTFQKEEPKLVIYRDFKKNHVYKFSKFSIFNQ